jgi:hypothetical protein
MTKNKNTNTESSRLLTDDRQKKRYSDTRTGSMHEGSYAQAFAKKSEILPSKDLKDTKKRGRNLPNADF